MAGLTAGLKIEVLSKSWECNTKLNTLTDARAWSEEHRYVQLSEYDDDELIRDQFCVKKKGRYSYVVWKKEAGQPEVVLNISGFVVSSFFGPINRHVNLRITRQNITIVGLGNPAFNSALSVLRRIYRLLDQSHPIGAMQPFRSTKVLDTPAFTAEARFLTSIEDVEAFATDGYSLRHSQDPQHILQSCVGSGKFAYTEDNHVELSELGDADPDTGYAKVSIIPANIFLINLIGFDKFSCIISMKLKSNRLYNIIIIDIFRVTFASITVTIVIVTVAIFIV
ncbi:uncharacterized protein LACBIDRAFT_320821 [Laccaria bicolor S238N-H82]|uniref:Predicted protein n=1 Tax=Laccaria bicolor (strain S238N-H82 / ATCC MYA-4686) TaxID=486041 RepID=B0CRD1_LACBS|nr:uncharacterized protein LACBIDRAFT_320821 [Laccaria bicolor S238N-H82]EDR15798.1 predicted protein [Laccaria bicolor S238N-H82]|eukprot:XP_001874006.1 predicted protein [Laccaria bicolor S238N-H82]